MKLETLLEAVSPHEAFENVLFRDTANLLNSIIKMCDARLADKGNITDQQIDDYSELRNDSFAMIAAMKRHQISYE